MCRLLKSIRVARWQSLGFILLACLAVLAWPPRASAQVLTDDVLRDKVKIAIQDGQRFLLTLQNRNGSFETGAFEHNTVGANCLVGLALITSGMEPSDPAIQRCLKFVRNAPFPTETYDRGLAILFYAAAGEEDDFRIRKIAQTLIDQQKESGGWGYGDRDKNDPRWDNSTTQFAILGLREAAFQTDMTIDQKVWRRARDHWIGAQTGPTNAENGSGWGYDSGGGGTRGSMTVAGLASLEIINSFLIEDQLTPQGKLDCCGQANTNAAEESIEAGIRWMNSNIRMKTNPGNDGSHLLYYLYGLERAGKFTGQRFFGKTDWYREGATLMVDGQNSDGSFVASGEGAAVGTSLSLLFLSKGLSPVLINKLQYGPRNPNTGEIVRADWNRHRHDVSNLVDAISIRKDWPHYLSWQTLDLRVAVKGEGVAALQQAPIAYLSGDQDLDSISEDEVALLRHYIVQGGFLFAVQNCESPAFDRGFRQLITRMFPAGDYQLRKLEPTHDIYRSEIVFASDPPELHGVDFGCRTAIVYAPDDHSCRWDKWMRNNKVRTNTDIKGQIVKSIHVGVNVVAYATGRELRDKLQRPETLTGLAETGSRGQLRIGRLKHSGGWDTAASAVRHLQDALNKVGVASNPDTPILAANDPALFACPILYMHGRKNFSLTDEEAIQLKAYFENGGFLMADACCGAKPFDDSFRTAIEKVFGEKLQPIPVEHEIFNSTQGFDVRKVKCRIPDKGQASALHAEETTRAPAFEGMKIKDRYVVVYSKYDISCALERQQTLACAGYLNEDAVKLAVNVVLYAMYQ